MEKTKKDHVCNMYVPVCVHTIKHLALLYCSVPLMCCLCVSVCLPLSVIESRVVLRWQLARLIPVREGRGPAPGVTQTCQA